MKTDQIFFFFFGGEPEDKYYQVNKNNLASPNDRCRYKYAW